MSGAWRRVGGNICMSLRNVMHLAEQAAVYRYPGYPCFRSDQGTSMEGPSIVGPTKISICMNGFFINCFFYVHL